MTLTTNSRAGWLKTCVPKPRLNQTPCASSAVATDRDVTTHSPPGPVRLVVLELSGQEDGDQNLENAALDSHHRDDTKHGVRCIPEFKEPLPLVSRYPPPRAAETYEELEESNHADNGTEVGDGGHASTELVRA